MSIQLASYEANSAALLGDHPGRDALSRAEKIAAALPGADTGTSPWAFPAERAVFRSRSCCVPATRRRTEGGSRR